MRKARSARRFRSATGALAVLATLGWTNGSAQQRLPAAAPAPRQASAARLLVFTGVTVIDVRDGRYLPDQTVIVAGNRIRTLGSGRTVKAPPHAQVVDARGQYLIPGLWDLHVHPMRYVDIAYPLLLANGVTGMRDAGSDVPLTTLRRWKREVTAGTRAGPRTIISGPSINEAPDTQATVIRRHHHLYVPRNALRRVVDSLQAAGADILKPYDLTGEGYLILAAEARRVGIPFGGHAPQDFDERIVSDSGARFVDHGTGLPMREQACGDYTPPVIDVVRCAAAGARFRRNGTWVVSAWPFEEAVWIPGYYELAQRFYPMIAPTEFGGATSLATTLEGLRKAAEAAPLVAPPSSTETWRTVYRQAHQDEPFDTTTGTFSLRAVMLREMPIVAGTDAFLGAGFPIPGFSLHNELITFVLHGMTPLQALQTATLNPALALRTTDSLGTIEVGKLADLVLLDADPLADIWNTTRIRAVVANGRYYDRTALDQLLARAEQAAHAMRP